MSQTGRQMRDGRQTPPFFGRCLQPCVLISSCLAVAFVLRDGLAVQTLGSQEKPAAHVSLEQLANATIHGRLGRPCGEFCTLSGVWRFSKDVEKYESVWILQVDQVDGKPLPVPVAFNAVDLSEVEEKYPDPVKGQRIVLRGYERAMHAGFAPDMLKESGVGQGAGAPRWRFTTRFEYMPSRSSGQAAR